MNKCILKCNRHAIAWHMIVYVLCVSLGHEKESEMERARASDNNQIIIYKFSHHGGDAGGGGALALATIIG